MLFIPDHFKTREMCNARMRIMPEAFHCIPDRFETQKVCIKVVEADPSNLGNVLDHLKIREMCDAAVREDPSSLIYVLDWFVKPQQVNMWYDDYYNDGNYDEVIGWHNGYQKRKAQKAKIKDELLPIAWHPNRTMAWCMSGDGKKLWK